MSSTDKHVINILQKIAWQNEAQWSGRENRSGNYWLKKVDHEEIDYYLKEVSEKRRLDMFQSVHRVLLEPYTVCHMIPAQMSRGQFLKHATLRLKKINQ